MTVGLHAASLASDNGLRVDRLFEAADLAVMHAYPIYANFGAQPLDPDAVPFATALDRSPLGPPHADGGVRCLHRATRAGDRRRGSGRRWDAPGARSCSRRRSSPSTSREVLPRLVEVGARGALLWCFADYDESLWDRPPCDTKLHERHFGLLRPDGSLKPHAEVVRRFIASGPRISTPSARARIQVDGDAFYADPAAASTRALRAVPGRTMNGPDQPGGARALAGSTSGAADAPDAPGDRAGCPRARPSWSRTSRLATATKRGSRRMVRSPPSSATSAPRPGWRSCTPRSRRASKAWASARSSWPGSSTTPAQRGLAVVPRCPFVRRWLERHPEQQDVLSHPLSTPEPEGAGRPGEPREPA